MLLLTSDYCIPQFGDITINFQDNFFTIYGVEIFTQLYQ